MLGVLEESPPMSFPNPRETRFKMPPFTFPRMLLAVSTLLGFTGACSVVTTVKTTFYGAPDNDPPGAATAYNCGGRNYIAGGTGTYANPLTFASAPGEYDTCKYLPHLYSQINIYQKPDPLLGLSSLHHKSGLVKTKYQNSAMTGGEKGGRKKKK